MKELFMIVGCLASCAAMAHTCRPARLAPSPYMDTEASANLPCSFDLTSIRSYRLSVGLVATPSNNVEVAFGNDADGDGLLSFDECALSLAWDCGAWTAAGRGGTVEPVVEGPDTNGVVRATLEVGVRGRKSNPPWLYDRSWNLMRITARGVDAPMERVSLKTTQTGCVVIIK